MFQIIGRAAVPTRRSACTGPVRAVALRATLTPQSQTDYSFQLEATGVPAQSDRLAVRLTLGSVVGRTIVKPFEP